MTHISVRSIERGLIAGFVATTVLSVVMLIMRLLGIVPQLDLVAILAHALGSRSVAVGWLANYVVGVFFWGPLFVWADRKMRFSHSLNGLVFASVVWFGVMLLIMPLAGEGPYGLKLGIATPTVTLFLHWLYGVVLGASYGRLLLQWSDDHSTFSGVHHA
jgi:hypothetical protein